MKKFSIKKRIGFMSAIVCTAVALLVTVGVGLLINKNDAEAALCNGPGCSYFNLKKELIDTGGSSELATEAEFQYKITLTASAAIDQAITIADVFTENIVYRKLVSVDFGGYSPQTLSTTYDTSLQRLSIVLPDGIKVGQEIQIVVMAKATQPPRYVATTASWRTYVYSGGDSVCKTFTNAQNYTYDNCSASLTVSIISIQLQIEKSIDGNYESYDDLHTGEEFFYTLTVTNNALGTYARDTITVYDEISPYLSNVHVTEILYFNKLVQGFDENNNQVNADPPICTISSQVMKCVFNSLLYDDTSTGNQIIIKVAATPSAQYFVQDPDSYVIANEAFVYSPSDSYCKTLDNAQEPLNPNKPLDEGGVLDPNYPENFKFLNVTDGKGAFRSRCRSSIEFSVIQPQLDITKEVDRDGKVWCYYKDSTWDLTGSDRNPPFADNTDTDLIESNYNNRKDITDNPNGVEECLNENARYREPTEAEIQAVWIGMSEEEKDIYGWKKDGDNNAAAYQSFKASYKTDQSNWVLVSEGTPGGILDNSVHNGETLIYTLAITNTGSGDTKGDIIVTDQLDKNTFRDSGISVQPLTGGVDCSVENLLVTCVIKRALSNEPPNNVIYIQIAATVENAGMIYNSAFVGGGGDTKCPIGEDGRLWCESNMVSTFITSPELHINKELRIDERTCPVGDTSETDPNDADPCWSLGDVIVNGSWAKYVIKVTNEGTANTSGLITVHDQIPDFLEVDRTTLSLKFDDETYNYESGLCEFRGTGRRDLYCRAYDTMEGGLLAKNGSWTIEFNVRVMQDVDITKDNNQVINYAYVWGGNDALCTNEKIELSIREAFYSGTNSIYDRCYDYLGSTIVSPMLSVKKTVSTGQVQAGKPFKYSISVDNVGDYDVPFGTTLVDILPEGIVLDMTLMPTGCEYNEATRRITCTINEKIVKNRPMTFEMSATVLESTTETFTNKTFVYNQYDKDCQTELAAGYTSRCHDVASVRMLSPIMKINMTTNILDTYVGGQVEYRIMAKNIGNLTTTAPTSIIHALPAGVKVLGVRAQKGVCYPNAIEIKCEIPAGIKPGETVNISVLTQVLEEGEHVSEVNLYGGGDVTCSVDENEQISSRGTSFFNFNNKVFAADTPVDLDDNTTDNNTDSNTNNENNTQTGSETTDSSNSSSGSSAPVIVNTNTTAEGGAEIANRASRCYDTSTIRASEYTGGVAGINDNGINSPLAGMLSITQAIGTISLLGVASYGLLKFGFVSSPVK